MEEDFCPCELRHQGVWVENVLFWTIFYDHVDNRVRLSFDIENEKFNKVMSQSVFLSIYCGSWV